MIYCASAGASSCDLYSVFFNKGTVDFLLRILILTYNDSIVVLPENKIVVILAVLKNKVFKIARIEEVEILDRPWEFESSHRKQGMDIFRMSGHIAKRVKLRLNIRAKNLLREEYPLAGKYLQKEGKYWILDTDVYDYAGVCRFYVGLADEIKIIDSPEFAAYAKEYMARNIAKL